MNKSDIRGLDEAIRIAAGVGAPALLLVSAISASGAAGLAGGAALTAALSLIGGPAGMFGGLTVLGVVGALSSAIASYGLEVVILWIYKKRIESSSDPNIVEACVEEINKARYLSAEQKKTIEAALTRKFSILLVGRTGTGKSSTINSLMGVDIAPVGNSVAVTDQIQVYERSLNGSTVVLYDTPGLCDSAGSANDEDYISMIKNSLPEIDLVLFVTPLNETRVSRDERIALRSLSAAVGSKLWDNLIVVFTFACSALPGEVNYLEFLDARSQAFREFAYQLVQNIDDSTAIPIVSVDNSSALTPDGVNWVSELFTTIIERCSSSGIYNFVESIGSDVGSSSDNSFGQADNESSTNQSCSYESTYAYEEPRINLDDEQTQRVKKGLKRSLLAGAIIGALTGIALVPGSIIAGTASAAAATFGGIAGAATGFWRWISKK